MSSTDEKLDQILKQLAGLKTDVKGIRNDLDALNDKVNVLRTEVDVLNESRRNSRANTGTNIPQRLLSPCNTSPKKPQQQQEMPADDDDSEKQIVPRVQHSVPERQFRADNLGHFDPGPASTTNGYSSMPLETF